MSLTADSAAELEEWVIQYSDVMYRRALFLTSKKEIAEDLVQESFLAAAESMGSYNRKSEPKAWLLGILHHKTADYFRQKFRNLEVTFDGFFTESGHWTAEDAPTMDWPGSKDNILDDTDFQKVLQYCLDDLPEIWRAVLFLKFLENKKGRVICQELSISQTNFWQILHRAKLQVRKCIEVYWFK